MIRKRARNEKKTEEEEKKGEELVSWLVLYAQSVTKDYITADGELDKEIYN